MINQDTSLEETHKDIVNDWNFVKTNLFTPMDVRADSHRRVWWLCSEGHEVYEPIRIRVKNEGCSRCTAILRKYHVEQRTAFYSNIEKIKPALVNMFDDLVHFPEFPIRYFIASGMSNSSDLSIHEYLDAANLRDVRIFNSLTRSGISTLDELLDSTYNQWCKIRNFGLGSQKKLYKSLKDYFAESAR